MNEQKTAENQNTETAVERIKAPVAIGQRGIQITDMDGLWRFALAVSKSGLAPKGITTPEAIFVALEMGLEVGLPPMAALQNLAIINGRPSIFGDAMLAVCRGTGEMKSFEEWYEDAGKRLPRNPVAFTDTTTAVCRLKRDGYEPAETGFSVQDAKTAKLWGKEGPWSQYPARMLRFRARSFALRDTFGDALKGLRSAEEVSDDPVETAKVIPTGFVPKAEKTAAKTKAAIIETTSEPVAERKTEPATTPRDVPHSHRGDTLPPSTDDIGTLQADWRDLCASMGVAFDSFRDWLTTTGRHKDASSLESWAEVPSAVLEPLLDDKDAVKKLRLIHGKVGVVK